MDIGTYVAGQMPETIMKEIIDNCLTFDYIDLSKIKQAIKEIYLIFNKKLSLLS